MTGGERDDTRVAVKAGRQELHSVLQIAQNFVEYHLLTCLFVCLIVMNSNLSESE